jgi:WS/DGAT/MGAT family acyltransferase
MHRLSGQDAGFLSLELPIQPMNIIVLAVVRPPTAPDGTAQPIALGDVQRHMARRLDELPAFRWRVKPVPGGLYHPLFLEDPTFALSDHLREHSLPAPGGDEELNRFCASLAETAMDRGHPLWQLVLVNGLGDGRQAIVLRIHHCLMDGFALVGTMQCIFSGEGYQPAPRVTPWRPDPVPSSVRLVLEALRDLGGAIRRLPGLIAKTRRGVAAAKARSTRAIPVPRTGVDAPPSPLNRVFTAERRFTRTWVPLAEATLVKNAAGVTINDVGLATVAAALRDYLLAQGALPARPLIASVPVGLEEPGAPPRTSGNRFSALTTTLATDIADPWERLLTISAVTSESKQQLALAGPELLPDWLDCLPPAVTDRLVRLQHRRRRADPRNLDVNLFISNLRGSSERWRLGAALVEDLYVVGPPDYGAGLIVMLMDYAERLTFCILSFADSLEAPGELVKGIHSGFNELVRLAELHGGPTRERLPA